MNLFERLSNWLSRNRESFVVSHRNSSIESFHNLDPEFNSDRWSRDVPRLLPSTPPVSPPSPVGLPSLPTEVFLREPYRHIEQPKPLGPIYEVPHQNDEPVVFNPTPSLTEEEWPEKDRIPWLPICGCRYMLSHLCDTAYSTWTD